MFMDSCSNPARAASPAANQHALGTQEVRRAAAAPPAKAPTLRGVGGTDLLAHSFYHLFIFVVGANPDPNEIWPVLYCKSPVIASSPDRP